MLSAGIFSTCDTKLLQWSSALELSFVIFSMPHITILLWASFLELDCAIVPLPDTRILLWPSVLELGCAIFSMSDIRILLWLLSLTFKFCHILHTKYRLFPTYVFMSVRSGVISEFRVRSVVSYIYSEGSPAEVHSPLQWNLIARSRVLSPRGSLPSPSSLRCFRSYNENIWRLSKMLLIHVFICLKIASIWNRVASKLRTSGSASVRLLLRVHVLALGVDLPSTLPLFFQRVVSGAKRPL